MNEKIEDVLDAVVEAQTAGQEPQAIWGTENVGWSRKLDTWLGFRVFQIILPPEQK